jgi:hypothetical protein
VKTKNGTPIGKTTWEKIYSFFGFWTYFRHSGPSKCDLVIYWCAWPFGLPYWRKFDLFRIDVSDMWSLDAQRDRLLAKGERS